MNKDTIQHFGGKHIKKYGNIFLFPEGWLLDYKYIVSMIVKYRKIYLKKWLPLFVTAADYALPFFFFCIIWGEKCDCSCDLSDFSFFFVAFINAEA